MEELITELGIGEAFVTALNEKGIPTPLVHCLMSPPQSRMDVLNDNEMNSLIEASRLYNKYKESLDPESAFEILSVRINQAQQEQAAEVQQKANAPKKGEKSTIEKVLNNTVTRQVARTAAREVTRGLLGVLKGMFK